MNPTSRAILQTVLTTDPALSTAERGVLQELTDGRIKISGGNGDGDSGPLSVTQKAAAKMLSVSRVTVWRMTRDGMLHPVEILPGIWRYPFDELARLARQGWQHRAEDGRELRSLSA